MTSKKFIKRALLICFTIWIYLILSITVYQNYTERRMYDVMFDHLKDWEPGKVSESKRVVMREIENLSQIDPKFSDQVGGAILLQVEENGEAWYVNPVDNKKYYLGRPFDAYNLIHTLGKTVSHQLIERYLSSDKFAQSYSGNIIIDEETKEIYYIHYKELKPYLLENPSDALRVMKSIGVGITNEDIRKIDVGELE